MCNQGRVHEYNSARRLGEKTLMNKGACVERRILNGRRHRKWTRETRESLK